MRGATGDGQRLPREGAARVAEPSALQKGPHATGNRGHSVLSVVGRKTKRERKENEKNSRDLSPPSSFAAPPLCPHLRATPAPFLVMRAQRRNQTEPLRGGTRRGEAEHFLLIVTQHFSSLPGLSFLPLLLPVSPSSRQGRTLPSRAGLRGAGGTRPSPAPLSRAPPTRAPAAPWAGARRERQEAGRPGPAHARRGAALGIKGRRRGAGDALGRRGAEEEESVPSTATKPLVSCLYATDPPFPAVAAMVKTVGSLVEFEEELKSAGEKLIVVDFSATWCGPCKMIKPFFHSLCEKYGDVVFIEIDVDDAQDVASHCDVKCMPTFQFYKNGKKVQEFSGANKEKLEETIKSLV